MAPRIRPGANFERALCLGADARRRWPCRPRAELGRCADRLVALAPKLRAKAGETIQKEAGSLSRFASRRLFERLRTSAQGQGSMKKLGASRGHFRLVQW
ncbi:DUF1403 family protein [Mesorhizobium loti]|uniref:DUF1403 family protein n=1 Tax=Mesorhizobium erdmanii TaxID=1777866 RepID=A0A6M7UPC9_9HYPH|nr:DUF1403 family protein [Mesorhizobium loti]QKC79111.1 DUF1403 family protein [Mesorhizobium erdmanii]